ncbi:MAG: hypothetical protein HYV26_04985 [Candidatus Hydrogenedentes bacterium]|nr:hypothetical protein [Candidatus Hydrogenedentota bacterium]
MTPIILIARIVWSAGLDFALAGSFLITWIAPETFGERTVHKFTFMMLLEFLVVHSTGFFGAIGARDATLRARVLQYGLLLGFYCLFAAAFSASYGGPWPLIAFVVLTLNKLPNVVIRPPDSDAQMVVMANWAIMTALYLGGVFLTVMYPVPPLGITPEVITRQQFDVGGLWPEEPYRVMAFGAFYFAGMGVVSLLNELIPFLHGRRRARRGARE